MKETRLEIYEPVMCCPSGVCGPEPDKELIRFNGDLEKLRKEYGELKVTRASLSFDANKFLQNKTIFELVKGNGAGVLPVTMLDGEIVEQQRYPKYEELKALVEARVNA
jgi:hypothetical protein